MYVRSITVRLYGIYFSINRQNKMEKFTENTMKMNLSFSVKGSGGLVILWEHHRR